MSSRVPMLEVDRFKRSGVLAIADVVYVEGLGLCSHQPLGPCEGHRMMDEEEVIHIVSSDRLFQVSQKEAMDYWDSVDIPSEQKVLERVAAVQHEIWSSWMKYLFEQCKSADGGWLIPSD